MLAFPPQQSPNHKSEHHHDAHGYQHLPMIVNQIFDFTQKSRSNKLVEREGWNLYVAKVRFCSILRVSLSIDSLLANFRWLWLSAFELHLGLIALLAMLRMGGHVGGVLMVGQVGVIGLMAEMLWSGISTILTL